jgi:hypothetical protein
VHWVVGKSVHLERALSLRNVLHLPTTQCACGDFGDFAEQRNGGGSSEKDLCSFIGGVASAVTDTRTQHICAPNFVWLAKVFLILNLLNWFNEHYVLNDVYFLIVVCKLY